MAERYLRLPSQAYLSTHAVAQRFGLSDNAIHNIAPAELPFIVVGRRGIRRYRWVDVEAYLGRHSVTDDESARRLVASGPFRR